MLILLFSHQSSDIAVIAEPFNLSTGIDSSPYQNINVTPFNLSTSIDSAAAYNVNISVEPFDLTTQIDIESTYFFDLEDTDIVYYFTLTGENNATTDIELPIENFQCRMRNGQPTYLSVTIPDSSYADDVSTRASGVMHIDLAYKKGDEIIQRATIVSADLESISYWEGGNNNAIILTGHKSETFISKNIYIDKSIYRLINDGKFRHRLATPNIYLKPGDTVTIGGDTFQANVISYYIAVQNQTMEIAEE